jgi:hypothetical protein
VILNVDCILMRVGEAIGDAGAAVCFGQASDVSICGDSNQDRGQGDASERDREDRREERGRGSLISSITSGDSGGSFGFRRGIARSWWRFSREEGGGNGEGTVGSKGA